MTTEDTPPRFPSASELCTELPLYAPYTFPEEARYSKDLYRFATHSHNIDTYCPFCMRSTVLILGEQEVVEHPDLFEIKDRTFEKKYLCSRDHSHEFFFYFRIEHRNLAKVGQSPSMADLEQGKIQRYQSILEREHYQELNRALGLASHGVGIGSFVYLRRIFERLVEEARQQALLEDEGWDEEGFQRGRMDERIKLLEKRLPPFLVEQRKLYRIMSKGVHSLSEETCLLYFPVIRAGIELILDQKLSLDQQRRKMEAAKRNIQEIERGLE